MKRMLFVAILLSAVGVHASDRLSNECIDLLAGELADVLDQDHSVCPDKDGHISFLPGGSAEINGIPGSQLRDLAGNPELYGACRDLFGEAPLAVALSAIDADPRAAMMKVFEKITWEWHYFQPPKEQGFTIYACVDLSGLGKGDPAKVHLYRSMCAVTSIYVAQLGRLNLGTRFITVATHEIGHVVDELSGCAATFSDDAETRATVYGLALAQCHARRWQMLYELLGRDIDVGEAYREAQRQKVLSCLRGKWEIMERQIAALRQSLATGSRAAASPLASISACAYAAVSGAAPRLDRCPTKED